MRRTQCLSIYPLPTDVDTVCCGLRCPLKTIVPLVSPPLLSFSSLSRQWPEVERRKSAERPPDGSRRSGGPFCPGRPRQWSSLWVAAGSHRGLYAGSIVLLHRPESLSSTGSEVSPPVCCSIPALSPPSTLACQQRHSTHTMESGQHTTMETLKIER